MSATENGKPRLVLPPQFGPRLGSVLVAAGAVFIFLSFVSFQPADLSMLTSDPNIPLRNIGGVIGAWLGLVGRGGFGLASFTLPVLLGIWSFRLWQGAFPSGRWAIRTVAAVCCIGSLATLFALPGVNPSGAAQAGGALGYLFVRLGRYYLGATGTALLAGCLTCLAWVLLGDHPSLPQPLLNRLRGPRAAERQTATPKLRTIVGNAATDPLGEDEAAAAKPTRINGKDVEALEQPSIRIRSTAVVPKPKALAAAAASSTPTPQPPRIRDGAGGFQFPPLDFLTTPPPYSERKLGEDLQGNARILEETLREFGIEAHCVNIDRGPAVTRYELAPAPGVKITRIVSLADDLALVLKAVSCHIVAPIPGKGLVGVEVPNSKATIVYLKELIGSRAFHDMPPLALAIGKDVSGEAVLADLRECPHLLVAGATGSGKTVFLNSLLIGMLYHAGPDELKFLMIDPKMVELVQYNDIPHLVAPVVTDSKKASAALAWAVAEMERRYHQLAKVGVRNIDGYNHKVRGSTDPEQQPMPFLVIVIDELADLMTVSSRDVEEAITRLSQLSRAVGIHVILATQRPSVDVITGVIKANFPARLAFQVASKVDSRTILDANGADKLVGRGDCLFLRAGASKPIRAQGCLVSDEEIERVVAHAKAQRTPTYDHLLMARQDRPADVFGGEKDELYDMAKKLVLETGQASTSLLQRRLRLGYGRAARILDLLEQEGIVGPPQGSRPREVLIDPETLANAS